MVETSKICRKCGETKPATEEFFYRHRTGLRNECKVCTKKRVASSPSQKKARVRDPETQKQWYQNNRKTRLKTMVRYYQENKSSFKKRWVRNKEHHRISRKLKKYGLDKETYLLMEANQNGRCVICGSYAGKDLVVDHDHTNGNVRELICRTCNSAIGFAQDDTELLTKIIVYLERQDPLLRSCNHDQTFVSGDSKLIHKLKKYGISIQQFTARRDELSGKCEICNNHQLPRLHVDHCHSTGAYRGLLCRWCNSIIAFARDDIHLIRRMIEYLEKHREK